MGDRSLSSKFLAKVPAMNGEKKAIHSLGVEYSGQSRMTMVNWKRDGEKFLAG